jgi:hypothetical protein
MDRVARVSMYEYLCRSSAFKNYDRNARTGNDSRLENYVKSYVKSKETTAVK